jgi:hypothetical protein
MRKVFAIVLSITVTDRYIHNREDLSEAFGKMAGKAA